MSTGPEREEELGPLTRLFHVFVDAHDEGEEVDEEELLQEAEEACGTEGRSKLEARIRIYRSFEKSASELRASQGDEPRELGGYPLLGTLARSAMSTVYRSRDPNLERPVVLKVMNTALDVDGLDRDQVLREARSLARMEQRGVVQVFHVGSADGNDFIVMEHLPGPGLHQVIRELQRLREAGPGPSTEATELAGRLEPFSARVGCLLEIVEALAGCHDRGLLHRDVKPSNILFDESDRPVLIDFGLVHDQREGEAEGLLTRQFVTTRGYSAPEQLASQRTGADPRSDQFSLGILAYEILTLRHPFQKDGRMDLEANERAEFPPPSASEPSLPRPLERILLHVLQRDPDARYPDLHALAADLRAFLEHRPISIAEPSLAALVTMWAVRRRSAIRKGLALFLLAVLVLLGGSFLSSRADRTRLLQRLGEVPVVSGENPRRIAEVGRMLAGRGEEIREWERHDGWAPWLGGLSVELEARTRTWWQGLRDGLRTASRECEELGIDLQYRAWEQAIEVATDICPDGACESLEELAGRGKVYLPPGVQSERVLLLQQGPSVPKGSPEPAASTYRPIPFTDRPRLGHYRALLLDETLAHVVAVSGFLITRPWGPRVDLVFGDIHPDDPSLASVEGRACKTVGVDGIHGPDVHVPSFRISPLLTVGEVREIVREKGLDGTEFENFVKRLELGSEDPAPGGHLFAAQVASAVGGFLPTKLELELAFRTGAASFPSPPLWGEVIADMLDGGSSDVREFMVAPDASPDAPYVVGALSPAGPSFSTNLEGEYIGMRILYPGSEPDFPRVTNR